MSQRARAARFRQLHSADASQTLVLANAWDAMRARLVEAAGGTAIATTNARISWALGDPDGPGPARAVMPHIRRAATAVLAAGTYDAIREQVPSPEANAPVAGR